MPSNLTRRPQATAFSIEDLMDKVQRGEVRVPSFQRPLKWTAEDVRALFDSVYRGYPIGTLLFWKHEAPAERLQYGPLRIDAPSSSQALWVVDGQQRLSSLATVLLREEAAETRGQDDFSLFFDLETEEIIHPDDTKEFKTHWLPLNVTLNSEHLLEWLDRYPGRAQHPEHTKSAIRFGKAIREFQVPAYIVDADEEQTLRIIFKRLNTSGKPLSQEEVFNALYGSTTGKRRLDLQAISQELEELGFGSFDPEFLVQAVLATQGLNYTQSFQTQLREDENLAPVLAQTSEALRDAIIFLKLDAGFPHRSFLLQQTYPLLVLARFFHLHPTPSPRSRTLLSRWLWLDLFIRAYCGFHRSSIGKYINSVSDSEEHSIQQFFALTRTDEPSLPAGSIESSFAIGHVVDLRIFMWSGLSAWIHLAMMDARPRHLLTGRKLDTSALLSEQGAAAFIPILPAGVGASPRSFDDLIPDHRREIANQLSHPEIPDASPVKILRSALTEPEILQSHLISPNARLALEQKRVEDFLALRAETIATHFEAFLYSKMRWDESERPSIQSLVISDEED
ncbi:DUF262 domain-containing protein [Myxococcus sp. AB025B]|uniref:DUF262 domain-containing protein n=1 Tax=Myxococcus sp. AB025B TaxID=2562794 RepID=UPI001143D00D|nr:DUF262 domain-containing protein [Myxococcus sp. AB025B]